MRASFGEGRAPFGAPSQRLFGAGPRFLTFRFGFASGIASGGPLRGPRVAHLGQALRPVVSQLLAGDRSVPGRSPGAAREQEERSSPARGRRSSLHLMTPHEASLTSEDVGIIA